jgi:hypothetical protein
MTKISISPWRRKPNAPIISATITSTGTDPDGWRRWWADEAIRVGTDWPSIINAHLTIVDQLRDADDADAGIGCSS